MELNSGNIITKLIRLIIMIYELLIIHYFYLVSINLKLTPKSEEETGYEEEIRGVLICLL